MGMWRSRVRIDDRQGGAEAEAETEAVTIPRLGPQQYHRYRGRKRRTRTRGGRGRRRKERERVQYGINQQFVDTYAPPPRRPGYLAYLQLQHLHLQELHKAPGRLWPKNAVEYRRCFPHQTWLWFDPSRLTRRHAYCLSPTPPKAELAIILQGKRSHRVKLQPVYLVRSAITSSCIEFLTQDPLKLIETLHEHERDEHVTNT